METALILASAMTAKEIAYAAATILIVAATVIYLNHRFATEQGCTCIQA
jgi:hypothetical protein